MCITPETDSANGLAMNHSLLYVKSRTDLSSYNSSRLGFFRFRNGDGTTSTTATLVASEISDSALSNFYSQNSTSLRNKAHRHHRSSEGVHTPSPYLEGSKAMQGKSRRGAAQGVVVLVLVRLCIVFIVGTLGYLWLMTWIWA